TQPRQRLKFPRPSNNGGHSAGVLPIISKIRNSQQSHVSLDLNRWSVLSGRWLVVLCAIRIVKVAARVLSYDTVVIVLRVIHITTDCVYLAIRAVDERASTNPLSFLV